jgi:DNA-binding transcriptional ArsR family regulator
MLRASKHKESVEEFAPEYAAVFAPVFATVFAALGDSTRLELMARLSDGETYSIAQLCEGMELTRQGVTKHLRVLERAGVVSSRRVGRENLFGIETGAIEGARDYLARATELASGQWDEAIERLRGVVEGE